jgi:putative ABC transport system permease protein
MLKNNLKIAVRSLQKNRLFAGLNVVGLALGLAVALVLFTNVRQEKSFDSSQKKAARIHRVAINATWGAEKMALITAPNAVGPTAKTDIPAVEAAARILENGFGQSAFITAGDKKMVEKKLIWADPALADVFDFEVVKGDLRAALTEPNAAAMSRSAAINYFGTANAVGQILKIDQRPPIEVKAVFEDFPTNSTLDPNIIGSFCTEKWANKKLVWSNASFETWLLLNESADRENVASALQKVYEKNVEPASRNLVFWLQPLADAHLGTVAATPNYERGGDLDQINILAALALAVLLLACFNYMNLATARSQNRLREVGVSKALGASRAQVAGRFYTETGVLVAVSLVFALVLARVGLPFFNQLADKNLTSGQLFSPISMLGFLTVGFLVALFSGALPALFLSSFLPKSLLQKTVLTQNRGGGGLRKTLVMAQFAVSFALIVGAIIGQKQLDFMQQKKLGFESEQVVAITTSAAIDEAQIAALANACRALSTVQSVCEIQTFPGGQPSERGLFLNENEESGLPLSTCRATPGFEKTLEIKLLAGQTLPQKAKNDTIDHVVLSKKGVDFLGLTPDAAIGKKVNCQLGSNAVIVGVMADFHSKSLHEPLEAYAFHDAATESNNFLMVKMASADLAATMKQLENAFGKTMPQSAFEYHFLDERIERLYRADRRTAATVVFFSMLSILISCLGLFGLAAFAAEKRVKEIGIRKVLGASILSLNALLARDFLKLVVVAIVVASPVAYFLMKKWLSDFAFRIEIEAWIFVAAGLVAVAIAFLTVSFQAIKAALADPVKSLRSE